MSYVINFGNFDVINENYDSQTASDRKKLKYIWLFAGLFVPLHYQR